MSNYKSNLQSNNTALNANNLDLQSLIDQANALPDAGSGCFNTATVTFNRNEPISIKYMSTNGITTLAGFNDTVEVIVPSLCVIFKDPPEYQLTYSIEGEASLASTSDRITIFEIFDNASMSF